MAWGDGSEGQTDVPAGLTNVAAVAAGQLHSLALKGHGTVVAWGSDTFHETEVPAGLSNVVALAADASHSAALRNDGTLVAWGDGASIPAELAGVVAIAGAGQSTLALKGDGTVAVLWGNLNAAPAGLSNVTAVAGAGDGQNAVFNYALALTSDNRIIGWGWNGYGQTNVPAWATYVVGIAAGSDHALALVNNSGSPQLLWYPTNYTVYSGMDVTLRSGWTGTPPMGYQWRQNGADCAATLNPWLTITNVQATNGGQYCVTATNAFGSVTSSEASLAVVLSAPVIVTQPANMTAYSGDIATALLDQLSYVPGGTPPSVTLAPTNQAVALGSNATFVASASGTPPLAYQWLFNQAPIAGARATLLTLTNARLADEGSYSVLVTNAFGSTNSAAALLKVVDSAESLNATNLVWTSAGNQPWFPQTATTLMGIAGGGFHSLALRTDGKVIAWGWNQYGQVTVPSSATNAVAMGAGDRHSLALRRDGTLAAWGNNSYGQTSVPASATNVTAICAGGYHNLAITNGRVLAWGAGGTVGASPNFGQCIVPPTLSNVATFDSGYYALAVNNAVGCAVSSAAMLSVYTIEDLASSLNGADVAWSTTNVPWFPETTTTHDGASAAQSGAITGSQASSLLGLLAGPATLSYWWKVSCGSYPAQLAFRLDGAVQNAIGGTVNWQQVTNYLGEGDHSLEWRLYPIYGSNAGGTGWVDQVQVHLGGTPPAITSQPASITTNAGNNVAFAVAAMGTPNLRYQWRWEGVDLANATNSTLTLNDVQTGQAGVYCAVVTNAYGVAVSSNVTLTVNASAPVLTSQSGNQTAVVNGGASFGVSAKGSPLLTYQWLLGGAPIPGATNATQSLTNLRTTDSGGFSVVVSNSYGAVTSSVMVLEVFRTMVVDCWPLFGSAYRAPSGLSNLVAAAAGDSHTVALRSDGRVAAWGSNASGQTNVPPDLTNAVAVAAGTAHSVALKADGTVVVWGDYVAGQQIVPAGLTNVTAIAAAASGTLALTGDGRVVGWGGNSTGQLAPPAGLSNVAGIALGAYNGYALESDGSLVQWGDGPVWQQSGTNAQLRVAPGMSDVVAVGSGGYSAWSLQSDGSVAAWGLNGGPTAFSGVSVAAAGNSAASDYALILSQQGTLSLSGGGSSFYIPYLGSGPSNVIAISAATGHAAVLVNDGTPTVARPLRGQTITSGQCLFLDAGIVGPAMEYQWQLNGVDLGDATNAVLTLSNVAVTAAGDYRCVASNSMGAVTSTIAALTVLPAPLRFDPAVGVGDGDVRLTLLGLTGAGPVVVYASDDLAVWRPIVTNSPVVGALEFVEHGAAGAKARFYRAVEGHLGP